MYSWGANWAGALTETNFTTTRAMSCTAESRKRIYFERDCRGWKRESASTRWRYSARRKIQPRATGGCLSGGSYSTVGFEWTTSAGMGEFKRKTKSLRKQIRIGTNWRSSRKSRLNRGSLFHRFYEKNGRTILRPIEERRNSPLA